MGDNPSDTRGDNQGDNSRIATPGRSLKGDNSQNRHPNCHQDCHLELSPPSAIHSKQLWRWVTVLCLACVRGARTSVCVYLTHGSHESFSEGR